MTRRLLIALLLTLLACDRGKSGAPSASAAAKPVKIAVIPKGTTHEFWKSVHAGAVKAAREVGVEVMWKGPMKEDDLQQQIDLVQSFVAQGVDGIVLAPLNDKALRAVVKSAKSAGIPVVVFDSALAGDDMVSFVATDNLAAGKLAGERMAKLVGDKGRVAVLRYQEGSASTTERERGFLERMKSSFPGITIVSSDQYAGASRETAKRAAENLLNRFGNDLGGVFTANESSTVGMLLALQDIKKSGKIKFVGFDASQTLLDAMRSHQLDGVAVQNPMRMGYLGVKTMVAHLRGKTVEKRIDTGVQLVTPETLDLPATKELVNPPIDKYLQGQ